MTDPLREEYFGHGHVTVIKPSNGWRALDFRELWAYRELLWVLAARDVKVRYKQAALGVAWAAIGPVATMIIFSVIFGALAKIPSDGKPYPVFVYAALLPWTFFSNAVSTASNSLVASAGLISKVYFPRLLIPLSSIGAGLVDLAVSTVILLGLMLVYGVPWTPGLLTVPVLVLITVVTALGVGTILAALHVAYRDIRYIVPLMMMLWMYATPVVYPASLVPDAWRWIVYLNPIAGLVDGFRAAFLGTPLAVGGLTYAAIVGLLLFFSGVAMFERMERRFADLL